jgi:hypothetical protein
MKSLQNQVPCKTIPPKSEASHEACFLEVEEKPPPFLKKRLDPPNTWLQPLMA